MLQPCLRVYYFQYDGKIVVHSRPTVCLCEDVGVGYVFSTNNFDELVDYYKKYWYTMPWIYYERRIFSAVPVLESYINGVPTIKKGRTKIRACALSYEDTPYPECKVSELKNLPIKDVLQYCKEQNVSINFN